jgi:hypothetical protein
LLLVIWHQHLWDPPGTQFLVSHIIQNYVQCVKANSHNLAQFPLHNLSILTMQLIHSHFICHCHISGKAAWSGKALYTTCTITEMPNPLSNWADTDTVVPVNVLQTSMNFNWRNVLHCQELTYTPLLHTHINVAEHQHKDSKFHHIPLDFLHEVTWGRKRIGGITLRALCVQNIHYSYIMCTVQFHLCVCVNEKGVKSVSRLR